MGIYYFLIVVVRCLARRLFIVNITGNHEEDACPFVNFRFFYRIKGSHFYFAVPLASGVKVLCVLPTILRFFRDTTTAFERADIAGLSFVRGCFAPYDGGDFGYL